MQESKKIRERTRQMMADPAQGMFVLPISKSVLAETTEAYVLTDVDKQHRFVLKLNMNSSIPVPETSGGVVAKTTFEVDEGRVFTSERHLSRVKSMTVVSPPVDKLASGCYTVSVQFWTSQRDKLLGTHTQIICYDTEEDGDARGGSGGGGDVEYNQ